MKSICKNCGDEYDKYDKIQKGHNKHSKRKRPSNSITCSPKCSKEYVDKGKKIYAGKKRERKRKEKLKGGIKC